MTKTLSAREVINAKHMKNKTVVGLRIINIVSSHFFFCFSTCALHITNSEVPFSKELFEDGLVAGPWQAGVAPQSRVLVGVLLPSS